MLDYVISFYNNYSLIFYILLIIIIVLEGPITIITLTIIAPRLGFWFFMIYIFAFIWEFFWDLLHYFIWRFFKKFFLKNKKFTLFEKIEKKIVYHSLFDKLIFIKYTPPITSIWLIYLWTKKTDIKNFTKYIFLFSLFNSLIISFIWFKFWNIFKNTDNIKYLIIWILFSFLILYFITKIVWKIIIDIVFKKNDLDIKN